MSDLLLARTNIIPVVSALPSNPYNGQEIYVEADATNGVYWHLVYRALHADGTTDTSSYKWHCLGGGALHAVQSNDWTTITNTAYATDANGPSITVPFGGDYDVEFSAGFADIVFGSGAEMRVVPAVSVATADDTTKPWITHANSSINAPAGGGRVVPLTGLAASAVIQIYARVTTSGPTGRLFNRRMRVTPIRVG